MPLPPPKDYASQFPHVNFFIHRPCMSEPPLCLLHQLDDGTYTIVDILVMHQLLDLKAQIKTDARQDDDNVGTR